MGMRHEHGCVKKSDPVEPNPETAVIYYRVALEKGFEAAKYRLSVLDPEYKAKQKLYYYVTISAGFIGLLAIAGFAGYKLFGGRSSTSNRQSSFAIKQHTSR